METKPVTETSYILQIQRANNVQRKKVTEAHTTKQFCNVFVHSTTAVHFTQTPCLLLLQMFG